MKKTLYLILALLYATTNTALAQAGGLIYTVAGGGTGAGGEGGPATSATIACIHGLMMDVTGNLYITHTDWNKIQKIDATTGIITRVVGTGASTGSLGDGGPATAATLDRPWSSCFDAAGNIYIADKGNNRIRKVDAATNIITTIAGGGTSTTDGVPATTANITPWAVVTDATGNLYIGTTNKVQKVNLSTGIITTYAGTGTTGDSGDGGPATAANIHTPEAIALDPHGNLYIACSTKVKMINASTGIISTIAGGGTSLSDGIPPTSAKLFKVGSLCLDPSGNIYIGEMGASNNCIRMIDAASGLIYKIAGSGAIWGTGWADGTPALSASVWPDAMTYNTFNKCIYYSVCSSRVWKFTAPAPYNIVPSVGGHFTVYQTDLCHGPDFKILTTTYTPGQGVKTYFGDGTSDTGAIVPGLTTGYHSMNHTYNSTGVYTIKHLLYNGPTLIDSASFPFNYLFCRMLPVGMYFDENSNCVKDVTEYVNHFPQKVLVDSNGVVLDTLSCTAGLQFYAYGNPGDVYNFRALSSPAISVGCPPGAAISDTLKTTTTYPIKFFGLHCGTGSTYDVSVYTSSFRRGPHRYRGTILVDNAYCHGVPGTLTMQVSPKINSYSLSPIATSISGSTITWNTSSLSLLSTSPYRVDFDGGSPDYLPGDTLLAIFNIAPTSGDVNITNNMIIRVDTVRSSYDPNMVEVTPTCIPAATNIAQLQYTVHFENMGNDTAHNIYVLDTLSGLLDASSLEMVISSAEMYISTMKDLQGRTIVKFNFPNIKLLDSSYHGLCDGMFVFKIKTKAGITAGTQIPHRVGIYFDDNPVVMTNNAYTTKGCPTLSIQSLSAADQPNVSIYPNPTTNELTIKMEAGAYSRYSITNTVGQDMITQQITGAQTKLNISTLPAGIYFISFSGDKGTQVKKFVKM